MFIYISMAYNDKNKTRTYFNKKIIDKQLKAIYVSNIFRILKYFWYYLSKYL